MEYIYASLILHSLKKPINEESLRKVIEAAGAEVDMVRIKATVAALRGVNIEDAIRSAALPAAIPATQVSAAPAAMKPAEEKREEKKEEEREEEVSEGLAALFGS